MGVCTYLGNVLLSGACVRIFDNRVYMLKEGALTARRRYKLCYRLRKGGVEIYTRRRVICTGVFDELSAGVLRDIRELINNSGFECQIIIK